MDEISGHRAAILSKLSNISSNTWNKKTEGVRMEIEKYVRARWGSDEEYFKELERFMKEHKGASAIIFDKDVNMPVRAEYAFSPYSVFLDHVALIDAIGKSKQEAGDE